MVEEGWAVLLVEPGPSRPWAGSFPFESIPWLGWREVLRVLAARAREPIASMRFQFISGPPNRCHPVGARETLQRPVELRPMEALRSEELGLLGAESSGAACDRRPSAALTALKRPEGSMLGGLVSAWIINKAPKLSSLFFMRPCVACMHTFRHLQFHGEL